jgi:uncharacterized protein (DUF433 family)
VKILDEAQQFLAEMSRAEKAQLLRWVVQDLGDAYPGIESRPDVCGGEPCIVRTRIPVWLLVQAHNLGTSEADLLNAYPTLRAEEPGQRLGLLSWPPRGDRAADPGERGGLRMARL